MNSKKNILGFVITVLMTVAMVAGVQGQDCDSSSSKKMEGSWKVIVTPGQSPIPLPPSFESIVTYVPGGGLIESDTLVQPNSIASSGQGAWEALGNRQFSLVFTKYLFSTQGQFQGSGKITETITFGSNDDEYTGVGSLQILSPAGTPLITIPVTTKGTRIRPVTD